MLEEFIKANKLNARIIFCSKTVHTAQQASGFLKVPLESIAKTILLMLDSKTPMLAVLSGNSKVSFTKACGLFNAKTCRLATPEEVSEITGYEIGGVPPVSVFGVPAVIDSKLSGIPEIVCGGGDNFHLLRISPKEILEFGFEAKIADIAE